MIKKILHASACVGVLAWAMEAPVAFAQMDTAARGMAASAFSATRAPGSVINLSDPAYGILQSSPSFTPTQALQIANLNAINNATAACRQTHTGGNQLNQYPSHSIQLPASRIDIYGSVDIRVPALAGWGCSLQGSRGDTYLMENQPDVPVVLWGGHASQLRDMSLGYATLEGKTAAALANYGQVGGHCIDAYYPVLSELRGVTCYGATELITFPTIDSSLTYGGNAGQNTIFSSTIADTYTSFMSWRCASFVTTSSATGNVTIAGTALTINSLTSTGRPFAIGDNIEVPSAWGTETAATIASGTSPNFTLSGSPGNVTAVTGIGVVQIGGGTEINGSNNYCSNGSQVSPHTHSVNNGWVFVGVVPQWTVTNAETIATGGVSTPAWGAGGDGVGQGFPFYFASTNDAIMNGNHVEAWTPYTAGEAAMGWGSAVNLTINGLDIAHSDFSQATGAYHLVSGYGANSNVVVNGANDNTGTSGSAGITLGSSTLDLGSVTSTPLTNTSVYYGPVYAYKASPAISFTSSFTTNDVPVVKAGTWNSSVTASGTGPYTATVGGLHGQITTPSLTVAAGASSSTITVTDTGYVNTLTKAVKLSVGAGGTNTGTFDFSPVTLGAGTFSFTVTGVTALSGTVVINYDVDNNNQ